MASERCVKLVFGPKRGQWRIEADLHGEERIKKQIADGKRQGQTNITPNESQHRQRAASIRALNMLQNQDSMRSTSSSQPNNINGPSQPQNVSGLLDPARLALPIHGNGLEELRNEIVKLQSMDESLASDQVLQKINIQNKITLERLLHLLHVAMAFHRK